MTTSFLLGFWLLYQSIIKEENFVMVRDGWRKYSYDYKLLAKEEEDNLIISKCVDIFSILLISCLVIKVKWRIHGKNMTSSFLLGFWLLYQSIIKEENFVMVRDYKQLGREEEDNLIISECVDIFSIPLISCLMNKVKWRTHGKNMTSSFLLGFWLLCQSIIKEENCVMVRDYKQLGKKKIIWSFRNVLIYFQFPLFLVS
jgi:hypothetical protein